jgi:hypothetical protein
LKRNTAISLTVSAVVIVLALATILLSHRADVTKMPATLETPNTSTPTVTPQTLPKVTATNAYKLIDLYFSSLKEGNFPAAYAYLSPDLKKTLTYQSFVSGFHGSRLNAYNSASLKIIGAGNFSLMVQVPFTLSGSAGDSAQVAVLSCVNISSGVGQPDWRVESFRYQPAGTPTKT